MTSEIPLVDVAAAFAASPDRKSAGAALVAALENTGFAYVVGHGVAPALIERAFAASRAFHALPLAAKLAIKQNAFHRGYMPFSSSTIVTSTVAKVTKPNQSESFMMMQELAPDDPDWGKPLQGPNQWPAELPDFKATVLAYNEALGAVGDRLVQCIAVGLGLEPTHFDHAFERPTTFVRMLHYPPHPVDAPEDLFGSAPHTDYGFLTLVCQDDTGGLEVKRRAGGWISATPVPGAFVLNAADILMRWTNNRFVSTLHRVANPVNGGGKRRLSIAYFVAPNYDSLIECLPTCRTPGSPDRYPPITVAGYRNERFARTAAPASPDASVLTTSNLAAGPALTSERRRL